MFGSNDRTKLLDSRQPRGRVDARKAKRQRVIDAFLHERLIDRSTYQEQLDLVNKQIAMVDLEIYDTKLEELDLETALNFATSALSNAAFVLDSVFRRSKTQVSTRSFP